jgi:PAS domain S-box-containing protein
MEKSAEKPKIKNLKNTIANLNREISRLSQKNETLTAEKKMLDEILDNLPGTFYIWDERPQLIRWNRRHEEITEYSGDEYPNMLPTDFFIKREHRAIEAAIQRVYAEGETTLEATLVTKSGKKAKMLNGSCVKPIRKSKSLRTSLRLNAPIWVKKSN